MLDVPNSMRFAVLGWCVSQEVFWMGAQFIFCASLARFAFVLVFPRFASFLVGFDMVLYFNSLACCCVHLRAKWHHVEHKSIEFCVNDDRVTAAFWLPPPFPPLPLAHPVLSFLPSTTDTQPLPPSRILDSLLIRRNPSTTRPRPRQPPPRRSLRFGLVRLGSAWFGSSFDPSGFSSRLARRSSSACRSRWRMRR